MRDKTSKNFPAGIRGFYSFRNGIKNGKLMALCVNNGFDVLLTIDKNLMFQQNLGKYKLAIVVLNSSTSKIEELVLFIPSFKAQAEVFEMHKAYMIER